VADIRTLADLTHDPQNARRHNPRNVGMIERALHEVGAARSIVVDENGVVLAGNATIEAAAAAGIERVQVVEADGQTIIAVRRSGLTPEQKAHLALYDNRAAELAEWDTDVLADLGAEIDLSQFWTKDELAALIVEDVTPGGGGDEFAPTPEDGPTRVQPGELWQLGRHRLLCGDSTKREDVERLMDGERAAALFTDPPYGVDYSGQTTSMFYGTDKRGVARERIGGDMTIDEATQLLLAVLDVWSADVLFLWHAPQYHAEVRTAAAASSWEPFVTIAWNKNHANFGAMGARYKPKFEMALGCKHDRIPWYGPDNEVTVWDIDRAAANEYHPTQKPIELFERLMRNHTQRGDICAEPFAGGGAQVIAGERQRRRVYACEIEPRYCDVILRRFEAETGQQAERIT
jgi:DNA modification methylase